MRINHISKLIFDEHCFAMYRLLLWQIRLCVSPSVTNVLCAKTLTATAVDR